MITLVHPAVSIRRATLTRVVETSTDWDSFEKNLKQEAKEFIKRADEEDREQFRNQFLGDFMEVFVEALIKTHGVDQRIGIVDYRPLNTHNGDEDLGVDGHGVGTNTMPATVQVKFRSDPTQVLTANKDHLSNFALASYNVYGVQFQDTRNMLIVTNCAGVHHFTMNKMLAGKVRCISRTELRLLVDGNQVFWDEFRAATM